LIGSCTLEGSPWTPARVTVSTEHPACSRGQAVILIDNIPHGPADLPGYTLDNIEADHQHTAPFELRNAFAGPWYDQALENRRANRALRQALRAAGFTLVTDSEERQKGAPTPDNLLDHA